MSSLEALLPLIFILLLGIQGYQSGTFYLNTPSDNMKGAKLNVVTHEQVKQKMDIKGDDDQAPSEVEVVVQAEDTPADAPSEAKSTEASTSEANTAENQTSSEATSNEEASAPPADSELEVPVPLADEVDPVELVVVEIVEAPPSAQEQEAKSSQ